MDAQLRLLDGRGDHPAEDDTTEAPTQWRIDETTRQVGRHGIGLARQALERAAQHRVGGDADHMTAA